MTLTTTLKAIRAHRPCHDGWTKLLAYLGKTRVDDEPLSFETILESNGLLDVLWCLRTLPKSYEPACRLLACDFAETILGYVPNGEDRPRIAIETARRFAEGKATEKELIDASDDAKTSLDVTSATVASTIIAALESVTKSGTYIVIGSKNTTIFRNWLKQFETSGE